MAVEGYLPPVVIEITADDKNLLAVLARDKAALEKFAQQVTEPKIVPNDEAVTAAELKVVTAWKAIDEMVARPKIEPTVSGLGLAYARVKKINDALATWDSTVTLIDTRDAQLAATLASIDATIASAKADAAMAGLGGGGGGEGGAGLLAGAAGAEGGLGLLGALMGGAGGKGGGGIFGMLGGLPAFGSILSMMGFGAEHVAATGVGVGGSIMGAGLGAGFLGLGMAGTGAVGMGTDMAGMGQAMNDVKLYRTALNALNTTIATYGANSTQAAAAQNHLNYVLSTFPTQAQGAIVQLSNTLTQLGTIFNSLTGTAEKLGAQIMTQAVKVGETFLPTIGKFATQNLGIIQKDLQPFFTWLKTAGGHGGLGIFTHLEKVFQTELPMGMKALETGFELLAKTITIASKYGGHFIHWIATFLHKMNGATFSKWSKFVNDMIHSFRSWFPLLVSVGKTLFHLFQPAVGLGDQLAKLLTGMFNQISGFLSGNHTILHSLFTAHAKEMITGIGKIVAALLPLLEQFALDFLQIATVGAQLATVLLDVTGWLLRLLDNPVVATIAGWVGAFFLLQHAFVPVFQSMATWLSTLGDKFTLFVAKLIWGTQLTGLDAEFAGMSEEMQAQATAMKLGVQQAFAQMGISAETFQTQLSTVAADGEASMTGLASETEAAGAAGAAAAGDAGLGALGGLSSILGPAGLLVAGGITVFGLASSLFHLGTQSAKTAQEVQQAAQAMTQKLDALPTGTLAQLNQDLVTMGNDAQAAIAKLNTAKPTTQTYATYAGHLQAASQAQAQTALSSMHLQSNLTALGTATGASSKMIEQAASAIGINLNSHLTTHTVRNLVNEIKTMTSTFDAASKKAPVAVNKIAATAKSAFGKMKATAQLFITDYKDVMAMYVAESQKTSAAAMAALVNQTRGGLTAFKDALSQVGVTIPQGQMTFLRNALTTGGKVSMTSLAQEIQRAHTHLTGTAKASMTLKVAIDKTKKDMKTGGEDAMTTLAKGIFSKKGHVSKTALHVIDAAVRELQKHQGDGKAVGAALATGIAQGLLSKTGAIASAAATVVANAVSAAKSAGKIKSPSALTAELIGLPLGQGIGVGILNAVPTVRAAMQSMVDGTLVPIRGGSNMGIAGNAMGRGINVTYGNIIVTGSSGTPQHTGAAVASALRQNTSQLIARLGAGTVR